MERWKRAVGGLVQASCENVRPRTAGSVEREASAGLAQAMAELRALEVERKGAWRSCGGSSRTCTGPNNAWTRGVQNRQRRGWIEGDSSSGDSGEDELSSRIGALGRRPLSSLPQNSSPFASQQHNSNSTRIGGSKIDLAVIMPRSRLLERAIAGSMHTRPAIAQSPDKGRRVDASATAYKGSSSSPSSPGRRQNTRTMPTSPSPAGGMGGPRRRQQQERGREAQVLADHVAKLQAKISELERRHFERQWAPARARANTRGRRAVRQQQQVVVVEDDMVVADDDDDGEEGDLEDMVEALRNAADRALVLAAQAEGSAQKWKARETRVIVKAVKKGGKAQSKVSPQPKRGSETAKAAKTGERQSAGSTGSAGRSSGGEGRRAGQGFAGFSVKRAPWH